MKLGKVALWAFIAFLISGVVFGVGFINDLQNINWNMEELTFGPGTNHLLDETKTANIQGITKIVVISSYPEVRVSKASGQEFTARLHGGQRLMDESGELKLILTQKDNTLTIEVKPKSSGAIGFVSSNLKLDISIPEAYQQDVSITSTSGSIHMEALQYQSLAVHSTSGSIDILNVSTESELTVSSSSGSILADEVTTGKLMQITSTSGSINAEISKNAQLTKVKSTSGSIEIRLAQSDDIDIDAKTTSGSIHSGLQMKMNKSEDNRLKGTTGTGVNKFQLEATSGSINIQ